MRAARLLAALLVVVATMTPLASALRRVFLERIAAPAEIPAPAAPVGYFFALLIAWAAVTGVLALFRRALVATGHWAPSGLADLDMGMHERWPRPAALTLGVVALLVAIRFASGDPLFGLAETGVAAIAVWFACAGPPAALRPIEEHVALPEERPLAPAPEPVGDDLMPLTYDWYFRRDPGDVSRPPTAYRLAIRASKTRYEEVRARDHSVSSDLDYVRFVRDGLGAEVSATVEQIRRASRREGLDTIAEINNVLAFAQRFAYVRDLEDKGVAEYPKFPLETLVEDRGDCEDHAILAAACLTMLGYDVCLVALDYETGPGHMALAVACPSELPDGFFLDDGASGRRFYFCEVSTDAAARNPDALVLRMGEAPPSARQAQLTLLPIRAEAGADPAPS